MPPGRRRYELEWLVGIAVARKRDPPICVRALCAHFRRVETRPTDSPPALRVKAVDVVLEFPEVGGLEAEDVGAEAV